MAAPNYSEFSAGDSLQGYVYQVEFALYQMLDPDTAPAQISIETIDDVVQGPLDDPEALLQLKLHQVNGDGKVRRLTDRHPDFWKTLRVWARAVSQEAVDPAKASFLFLTTAPLSDGCEIGKLLAPKGSEGRQPSAAVEKLEQLASDILSDPDLSPKSSLVKGASAFSALLKAQKIDLVRNIQILTDAPTINDLRKKIDHRLRARGIPRQNHEAFVELILGWWYSRAVEQIGGPPGGVIPFDALETRISEIAKLLAAGCLHAYQDLQDPTDEDLSALEQRLFVRQMGKLGVSTGTTLAKAAMVDFYKAEGHIKRWAQEFKLEQSELDQFTNDLKGIWGTNFGKAEIEALELGENAEEIVLQRLGRDVLLSTVNSPAPNLKEFEAGYIARGTFHVLANRPEIGWHPRWQDYFKGEKE